MNSVHLIGRLATDVDVKEVNGGSKVSSFILAVDRSADEADFAILHTKVLGCAGLGEDGATSSSRG
jgi:single-stranded DNA-binding protein